VTPPIDDEPLTHSVGIRHIFATGEMVTRVKRPSITCRHCGSRFRPPKQGRRPNYCSASCRQRAYEKRRLEAITNFAMTTLKADIAAMETRSRKGQLKHLIFTAVDEFGLEAVQATLREAEKKLKLRRMFGLDKG
jgi:hypothetical protein